MTLRLVRAFILLAATASAQPANPPQFVYGTYVGTGRSEKTAIGNTGGIVFGLAADSAGHAYLSGLGPGLFGSICPFLTKLSPAGDAKLWTVCLPLAPYAFYEQPASAIAVDPVGEIYVVGPSPISVVPPILIKLTPDGKRIFTKPIPCGSSAIALDNAGNIYLTGFVGKSFPYTPGALMGSGNTCVAKLDPSGDVVYAATLDFGQGNTGPQSIAVDGDGQAWVVGYTCACPNGGGDCRGVNLQGPVGCAYGNAGAVRKLDANGAKLLVTETTGGGISGDNSPFLREVLGVAVDAAGSAWITGTTGEVGVPTRAFVSKLSSSGDTLYYASPESLNISPITVDAQGRPYYATYSADFGGGADTTITGLSPDGSTVEVSRTLFSTPVQEIALDGNGGLYIAGNTATVAFITTPGAYEPNYPYPGTSKSGYAAKFDLTQASPGQLFYLANAASLSPNPPGAVTPGEIVSILGAGLPTNPKVTFDGHAALILYAGANQINAVVPFEITSLAPLFSLEGTGSFILRGWPAVPGLFTANGGGMGQLAALNQDGTVNSSSNPAKAGSVVSVLVTGAGAMTPPIGDGQLGPLQPPYPVPVLGASATINYVGAPVLFAGQAPGLIAGVIQVNVQIPPVTPSGAAQLLVYIGNYNTQIGGTTIAVQ